jgi:hypothetical protein
MTNQTTSLKFSLQVEDGWPPVAVESLPFERRGEDYEALFAPLFVKNLSVGDRIAVTVDDDDSVVSWQHTHRSSRTTIWLLRLRQTNEIAAALSNLRSIGCNTVGLDSVGSYAIDIPDSVSIESVDAVLDKLDRDSVAIAYPSMRHPEAEPH